MPHKGWFGVITVVDGEDNSTVTSGTRSWSDLETGMPSTYILYMISLILLTTTVFLVCCHVLLVFFASVLPWTAKRITNGETKKRIKRVMLGCQLLVFLGFVLSFTLFLRLPETLREDLNCDEYECDSFIGHYTAPDDSKGPMMKRQWFPFLGWMLALIDVVFVLTSFVLLVIFRFRAFVGNTEEEEREEENAGVMDGLLHVSEGDEAYLIDAKG